MARRVVILLADGLRPDAVTPVLMPSLDRLGNDYTRARVARTVQPSVTVAALASLATGVGPRTHRLTEPGLGFLPALPRLRPVAQELQRGGIETAVVCGHGHGRPVRDLGAGDGRRGREAGGRRAKRA
jgi:hypothetical protein